MPSYNPPLPLFEVFVEDDKVALLYEPEREEMFWCSYRVEPTSPQADIVLRDEAMWNHVKFTIKSTDGRTLQTFTGGDYVMFCRRETNRLSFRSLWPIDSAPKAIKSKKHTKNGLWTAVANFFQGKK